MGGLFEYTTCCSRVYFCVNTFLNIICRFIVNIPGVKLSLSFQYTGNMGVTSVSDVLIAGVDLFFLLSPE